MGCCLGPDIRNYSVKCVLLRLVAYASDSERIWVLWWHFWVRKAAKVEWGIFSSQVPAYLIIVPRVLLRLDRFSAQLESQMGPLETARDGILIPRPHSLNPSQRAWCNFPRFTPTSMGVVMPSIMQPWCACLSEVLFTDMRRSVVDTFRVYALRSPCSNADNLNAWIPAQFDLGARSVSADHALASKTFELIQARKTKCMDALARPPARRSSPSAAGFAAR